MKISKLHINNFRCFEDYELVLAPEITVIIGRNGAGKTTIINALHKALSFIFASAKSLGKDFLSAGNPSLKVNSYEPGDYRMNYEKRTIASSANIHAEAVYSGHPISWDMYKRAASGAALYSSKYKEAFQTFMNAWKNEGADLPLLAYYSDSYPHKNLKETKYALQTITLEKIPRNFGYYQWNMEGACTSIWESRFCNILAQKTPLYTPAMRVASQLYELENKYSSKELENNEEYIHLKKEQNRIVANMAPLNEETNYIESHLQKFVSLLPSLKGEGYDIDYFTPLQTKDGYQLQIVFKNGKTELIQDLPAGYRRLYSIVLDMAYRAYILNGNSEPTGIVLIDEVDLHLHPSLEQCVVSSLHETFPQIQFILSTHSASVISNLETSKVDNDGNSRNKILFMQEGQRQAEELPSIYGLDYNSALRDFMDTSSRNMEIKDLMDEYLTYCSLHLEEDAEIIKAKLKSLLGRENHPVLFELEEKRKKYEVH